MAALRSTDTELCVTDELKQAELEQICQKHKQLKSLKLDLPYECETVFDFAKIALPNLESLELNCITLKNGIDFQQQQFPKLSNLDIMNVNVNHRRDDGCDFDFDLPKLVSLSIQHTWCNDAKKFAASVAKSVELRSFSGYKFRHGGAVTGLAFPSATRIELMRAECWTALSFWAPQLQQLTLRSNWDMATVTILTNVPKTVNKDNIPKIAKAKYSKFDVSLIYCEPKFKGDTKRIKSTEITKADDDW
mmetsp:Transcript_48791/g.77982  ORF Transcript_48791/g.77982 Transcript_48791/m.77982 type:complete len:248 (-) Transcript_48791:136-879(-)